MKRYKGIKIRTRLLVGFSVSALIAGIIGYIGFSSLVRVTESQNQIANVRLPGIQYLSQIESNLERVQKAYFKLLSLNLSPEEREDIYTEINAYRANYAKANEAYKQLPKNEQEEKHYQLVIETIQTWRDYNVSEVDKINKEIMTFTGETINNPEYQKLYEELNTSIIKKGGMYHKQVMDEIKNLVDINLQISGAENIKAAQYAKSAEILVVIFIVIGIIVSITIGIYIAVNIQNIIASIIEETKRLVQAALDGRLETRGDPEKINFEFREIIVGINNTLDAVITPLNLAADYISRISKGDMPEKITAQYKGDFNTLKNNLNILITSTNDIIEKAKLVAEGDLRVTLKKRSENDELMIALINMVEKINEIVSNIYDGADNITNASAQLSSASEEMSQGSTEQATSAEEVTSAIEEMNANIAQNSDNAQQTERIAVKASKDIIEANHAVEVTLKAMLEIADKISVINEIAEKTDILAINAAIEAARAGEHGKGFAVVAAEVRKLAENSQLAAKEIGEVSKRSVEISKNSGVLLSSVVPDIQKTTQLVQEIAAASAEQSSGAHQILSAINQLNTVVQQNAASAEELSSNSEEMTAQAETLKELVGYFTLRDNSIQKREKNHKQKHAMFTPSSVKPSVVTKPQVKINLNMDEIDNDYAKF